MGSLGWFVCGTRASNLIDPAYFAPFKSRGEENMPQFAFSRAPGYSAQNGLVLIKVYRSLGS